MGDTKSIYASDIIVPFKIEAKDGVPEITGTLRLLSRVAKSRWFKEILSAFDTIEKNGAEGKVDEKKLEAARIKIQGRDSDAAQLIVDHIVTWSLSDPISLDSVARFSDSITDELVRAVMGASEAARKN